MSDKTKEINELIESLSLNERKVIPCLALGEVKDIEKKSGLDETSVNRALQFLSNKKLVELGFKKKEIIDLDVNGILYLRKGLPERVLINKLLEANKPLGLDEAEKMSKLSEKEFKAALGALKKRALVDLKSGKIHLTSNREEITAKSLEERFIELLPLEMEKMQPEQKYAFQQLKNRKDIVKLREDRQTIIKITELGKQVADLLKGANVEGMIEGVTSELIVKEGWKGKKFRRYDLQSKVPEIHGGKRHFVNQAIDYAKKVWTDMGFKEMTGKISEVGFWNFDALFQPQDHPAREMQDTFYISDVKGKLPDKKIIAAVEKSHEGGVDSSKGWSYEWKEDEAKRVLLRTHTTCLSARTLALLGALKNAKDKKGKFFAVGKCFRNETVDWSHGFEFNQTEGIVIDKDANFRHLLGYLKEFFKKMGHDKIRFRPSYFPYTEPSVEIDVYIKDKNKWLELGGAGMFRPEVTIPLLGEHIPVLAWGPGFDRILMDYYEIKDLRELYENNLSKLRSKKIWIKS